MASYVPHFEFEGSSPPRGENHTARGDEEIMELLWHDGQVVTQTQNQRSIKKQTNTGNVENPFLQPSSNVENPFLQPSSNVGEIPSVDAETLLRQRHQHQQILIQEDELASWLQYPLDDLDREIYPDFLCSTISQPTSPQRDNRSSVTEGRPQLSVPPPVQPVQSTSITARPPIALPTTSIVARPPIVLPRTSIVAGLPPRSTNAEIAAPKFQNFLNFSRKPNARIESGRSSVMKTPRELTTMDSNETPTVAGSSAQPSSRNILNSAAIGSTAGKGFPTTCDLTMTTTSPDASVSASVETTPPMHKPTLSTPGERKRKYHSQEREPDNADSHSEGAEDEFEFEFGFRSDEVKKQSHKSTSVKRSRAAEVHNLSERKRRDRINEKMKALQELIPRCNKVDKASMLDEAIEYLKSLQLQVQMMSMGCGMVPMMYPGAQQYMPSMGMGMGMQGMMGMGMGMGMGMMGMGMQGMDMGMGMGMNQPMMTYPTPGFPLQAPRFPMPSFPAGLNSLTVQASNQPFQQPQVPPVQSYIQNQVVSQPNNGNHSNGGNSGNPENHKIG